MANRGGETINHEEGHEENDTRHTLFRGGNDEGPRGGMEEDTKINFAFPIMDVTINVTMKNIPMASLPLF